MRNYIGEIAGLATSIFYAINTIFITRASNQVGAIVSNRARVAFALIYLMIINLIFFHQLFPFSAGADRWAWLSISGVIGLAFGDAFLFQSFVMVGPLVGSLLLSLAPIFGALEAWIIFDETLSVIKIIGVALTLTGIIWVIAVRGDDGGLHSEHKLQGIIFGVLSAVCQATGFVLSKRGMGNGFSPFQANAIRMLAALVILIVIMIFQKETGKTIQAIKGNFFAFRLLLVAGFIGPVLGVSASLLSVQYAEVGVASTLTSLSPVFMLPLGYFFLKEKFHWQAVAGTILAVVGVAVLFLS